MNQFVADLLSVFWCIPGSDCGRGGSMGRITARNRKAPPHGPIESILSRQDSTRDKEKTGNYVREYKRTSEKKSR